MRIALLGIAILTLIVPAGLCEDNFSSEKELVSLRRKISELENMCTPKKGTMKKEVEAIFGEGEPASSDKLTKVVSPDSPYRSYKLCEDGVLVVHYMDNKVSTANYSNPHSTKGRVLGRAVPIEEQLREARHRLEQMEAIYKAYMEKRPKR